MSNNSLKIAEVISIGDEMTSGARLDTNSQWLSTMLGDFGVKVMYHSTVGDSLDACHRVMENAARRADIVVMTGGLGPTADDLTREVLAALAGVELEFREEAMQHIESLFARRNRSMPERNRVQAMFPAGSKIIPNPQGTAPGIDLKVDRDGHTARFFALPGVPAEMQQMWEQTVSQEIRQSLGSTQIIRRAVVKCFGLGESEMEARLGGMIARLRSPLVGITVSKATISLRIEAIADTEEVAAEQIQSVKDEIYAKVGSYVYGEGEDYELPDALVDLLWRRQQSICVIELGLDSLLSGWLAAVDQARGCYKAGLHANNLETVCRLMQLDEISKSAAANELLKLSNADWCLLVDRYPSLIPESGKPLPAADVHVLLCGRLLSQPAEYLDQLGGHPDILQARIAKAALFHAFCTLKNFSVSAAQNVMVAETE